MAEIEELMGRLRQKGITLWLDEDELRFKAAKGAMSPELMGEIKEHRQAVIWFLRRLRYLQEAEDEFGDQRERPARGGPLSYTQQSMWFFESMNPGNTLYHISNGVHVEGKLREDILTAAMNELAKRHESLRTVFVQEGERPERRVMAAARFQPDIIDLTMMNRESQDEVTAQAIRESAAETFTMATDPPWRLTLIRQSHSRHTLVLTIHHIIADAWSNRLLFSELFELYQGKADPAHGSGRPPQPAPIYDYSDFVLWQRRHFSRAAVRNPLLAYWKNKMAGYETVTLPPDMERPAIKSYDGKSVTHVIKKTTSTRILNQCRERDITPYMYLLAGLEILLSRYTGQTDIVLGTVIANRAREEVRDMAGLLINTLVIRDDLSGDPSVSQMLDRVKKTTLESYTWQELPFDLLLQELKPKRDAARTPVFQIMYIHQSVDETIPAPPGLRLKKVDIPDRIAPFDLRLSTSESKDGIGCVLDYSTQLYHGQTVRLFLRQFEAILDHMSCQPETAISKLKRVSDKEQEQILTQFNRTATGYSLNRPVHRLFEDWAREQGERTALVFEDRKLNYRELNQAANRLAGWLRQKGVGRNVPVGLSMNRSLAMVTAILGILKAGGAYIPIDPDYPGERIAHILADARAGLLLVDEAGRQGWPARTEPDKDGATVVCLPEIEQELAACGGEDQDVENDPEDISYIIYTSGSTGKPKGAMNTHKGCLNHKLWMKETFAVTPDDVFLQKTTISFDVSVWEFFLPLITGARLVIARPGGHRDPDYLAGLIREQGVTMIHFVPSMLQMFIEAADLAACPKLRMFFVSGEALSWHLLARTKERFPVPVINEYGPAECSDICTAWECRTDYTGREVPIGKPIANARNYILDAGQNLLPVGVSGEIYIGGAGVGKGYLNNPELTRERFWPDPFYPGGLMYRTGDLGRFAEDGNILYEGRCVFQVKIRGMRVETGEIEKVILEYGGIKNCTVILWESQNKRKHLAAYYINDNEAEKTDPAKLRQELKRRLPEYMVPDYYTELTEFPVNPNGKLERRLLPEPVRESPLGQTGGMTHEPAERADNGPQDEAEQMVMKVWQDVLGLSHIDRQDDFFEIGGESLLLINLYRKLKELFPGEYSLMELASHEDIRSQAEFLTGVRDRAGKVTGEENEDE